jgi:hypothetical protein
MSTQPEPTNNLNNYRVAVVEKAEPPIGYPAGNWHRYVIEQGSSTIEGYRTGTLKSVTQHAESFASDLNERGAVGYSTYSVRKKK